MNPYEYNIGIPNTIDNKKLSAAIIAMKYIISKDLHREAVYNQLTVPFMPSLYDDEELCKVINCEMFKNLQLVGRHEVKDLHDVDSYTEKLREYFFEFIYGNKNALDVLKKNRKYNKNSLYFSGY